MTPTLETFIKEKEREFYKSFHDNTVDGFVDNTTEEIMSFLLSSIREAYEMGRKSVIEDTKAEIVKDMAKDGEFSNKEISKYMDFAIKKLDKVLKERKP